MRNIFIIILLVLAALTLACGAGAEEMPLDPYRAQEMARHQPQKLRLFAAGSTLTVTISDASDVSQPVWNVSVEGGSGEYTCYFSCPETTTACPVVWT